MELWIRSQDKKNLKLAKQIEIIEYDEKTFAIEVNNWAVGHYETKERALEVLDEIQDLMRSLTDSDLKIIQYEMPKD